jgi:hypothetical protein
VIDCLPYETRVAMLEGLRRYPIIAGAYSSRDGGVCPMLAAHRCGGRTDFRSFARAWDRFTGVARRSRRASERELRTLRAQLEASILAEDEARAGTPLLDVERPSRRVEPDDLARKQCLLGEAWLLPFREWDAYARALELALGVAPRAPEPDREPVLSRQQAASPGS